MPAAKRKRTVAAASKTRTADPMPAQRSIRGFARVSKSVQPEISSGGQTEKITTQQTNNEPSRKRKAHSPADSRTPDEDGEAKRVKTEGKTTGQVLGTPRKRRWNEQMLPTPDNTPVKPLKFIDVGGPEKEELATVAEYATPPNSPRQKDNGGGYEGSARDEVEDMISLHSSFLKALSLHRAHHGSIVPIDLSVLSPSISKIWRKHKVTLLDIQRIVALSDIDSSRTCLVDYGKGRICLEACQTGQSLPSVSDTEQIKSIEKELRGKWRDWVASRDDDIDTTQSFIDSLPLAPVTQSSTSVKIAPLFTKGQTRLASLKQTIQNTKSTSPLTTNLTNPTTPTKLPSLKSRTSALLATVQARQAHAKTLPPPPSRAATQRQAALARADEIMAALSLMQAPTGGSRCSFTQGQLVQKIQGSVRSPLSKEEVEACLVLLAEEVAVGFVRFVALGSVSGVVLDHSRKPGDLASRIADASATGECL